MINRHPRRLLGAAGLKPMLLGALLAPVAAIALAPSAMAAPTGEYAVFANCPLGTTGVNRCVYAQTTSGEVKIGNTAVPITNTITLQGGVIKKGGTETFVEAANGETLSKAAQPVPGGLAGLVKCNEISNGIVRAACELVFENGLTGVTATTELAGPVGLDQNNLVNAVGTALTLPVKVHLSNPFLGSECYIGSSADPVTLELTTGTTSPPPPNTPISGKVGTVEPKNEAMLTIVRGNSLVDNSFSAPEVSGCGGILSSVVDPVVDAKLGLPSAAGSNTAILDGMLEIATKEGVLDSE